MKYTQKIIPRVTTPERFLKCSVRELRAFIFDYMKTNYANKNIINVETGINIIITTPNLRKTARGEAMYYKKASVALILPELLKYAKYNNFGTRKPTDNEDVIGFLNFKAKCIIDNKEECIRLSVQLKKGGKFYYNIEVNKKPN